jgi:PIN domain nuclease of toxin-antitoxin system
MTLQPAQLSQQAVELIKRPENIVYVSVISSWEICVKYQLGKLHLPVSPQIFVPQERNGHQLTSLELTEEATFHLNTLPNIHKDPFDRILICQAIENGLTLLTPDEHIHQYPVEVLW